MRGDRGLVFENLTALCLLKRASFLEDGDGRRRSLGYLRTKEGKEVDFLLIEEGNPALMMEAKAGDRLLSPALPFSS